MWETPAALHSAEVGYLATIQPLQSETEAQKQRAETIKGLFRRCFLFFGFALLSGFRRAETCSIAV